MLGNIFGEKVALDALELLNPLLQSGVIFWDYCDRWWGAKMIPEMLHFFSRKATDIVREFLEFWRMKITVGKCFVHEAFENLDTDVFVMTDADIVHVSGDAFTKLATSEPRSTMLASWMGEYNPKHHSMFPMFQVLGPGV